jgi:hypothetical protein
MSAQGLNFKLGADLHLAIWSPTEQSASLKTDHASREVSNFTTGSGEGYKQVSDTTKPARPTMSLAEYDYREVTPLGGLDRSPLPPPDWNHAAAAPRPCRSPQLDARELELYAFTVDCHRKPAIVAACNSFSSAAVHCCRTESCSWLESGDQTNMSSLSGCDAKYGMTTLRRVFLKRKGPLTLTLPGRPLLGGSGGPPASSPSRPPSPAPRAVAAAGSGGGGGSPSVERRWVGEGFCGGTSWEVMGRMLRTPGGTAAWLWPDALRR